MWEVVDYYKLQYAFLFPFKDQWPKIFNQVMLTPFALKTNQIHENISCC